MRNDLKVGFVALLVLLFGSSFATTQANYPSNDPFTLNLTGLEETVIPNGQWGLNWMPDGNLSFIKSNGDIHVWFAAGKKTYYLLGPTFESLAPYQLDTTGNAVPVLEPSGFGFDKDYAGSAAVIRAVNGSDLLMFYHAEDQTCSESKAKVGIGLARSSDGGVTWSKLGQIISSSDVPTDCNYSGFKGAGNPSVLISQDGQYIYIYYLEWLTTRPDSISLARAARSSDGIPGSWFKYKNGGFSEPGLGGASDAVIQRASQIAGYAGVPNVTYNFLLRRYLAVVVGHNGFYHTSSTDGVSWNTPTLFWEVPALTWWNNLNDGDSWYYYPTLISTDQDTDDTTVATGYLYYAHGVKNGPPHYMARRPIQIESVAPTALVITGPTSGTIGITYPFTATVDEVATPPFTYTWQTGGQPPQTHVRATLTDTASFAWSATGSQVLTVAVSNTAGQVTATHTITLSPAPLMPLQSLTLTGPATGYVTSPYSFTVIVGPANAAPPITYTWQADGRPTVVHVTPALMDSVTFTWSAEGTHSVLVIASNAVSTLSATQVITLARFSIYLPLVLHSWPPFPYVSVLNSIDNPTNSNSYVMSWTESPTRRADTYTLQEATSSNFSTGLRDVHTIDQPACSINNQLPALITIGCAVKTPGAPVGGATSNLLQFYRRPRRICESRL